MHQHECPNCGASIELDGGQDQAEYTACPNCWFSFMPPRRARYWDELVTSAKEVRTKAAEMPAEKSFVWTILTIALFGVLAAGTFWYRWSSKRPPMRPTAVSAFLERDSSSIELHASPFSHSNPLIRHIDSIWRIRPKESAYRRFSHIHASHGGATHESISLDDLGPAMPEYVWSVTFVDSNGNESRQSVASEFRSPVTLVPIDLSRWFNADVVADEGDDHHDTLGGPYGRTLLFVVADDGEEVADDGEEVADDEEGMTGEREEGDNSIREDVDDRAARVTVQGLPRDRVVGSHRLGDYAEPNAIQRDVYHNSPIEVDVERGFYLGIRLVVASVYGDALVPVQFQYDDGTTEQKALPCPDWQSTAETTTPPCVPLLTGMDCYQVSKVRDFDGMAIHEVHLKTDVSKTLVRFTIDTPHAVFTDVAGYSVTGICRMNVLAATALRLADSDGK